MTAAAINLVETLSVHMRAQGLVKSGDGMIYKVIGFDPSGHIRVYGESDSHTEAFRQCVSAAIEYMNGRPDTAPLTSWDFRFESELAAKRAASVSAARARALEGDVDRDEDD